MPNRHGFDELPMRGSITLRCIWCGYKPPRNASEPAMRQHHRKHRKDIEEAAAASKREVDTAQMAIVV